MGSQRPASMEQGDELVNEDSQPPLALPGALAPSDRLVAVLVRRLTELRLANGELRQALAGLDRRYGGTADCFEFAPVACCGLDSVGNVIDVNVAGSVLFGCSRSTIVGRPLDSLVIEADRRVVGEHLRLCMSGRLRAATDARVLGHDGIERAVQIVSAPLPYASGGELAVVTCILDIVPRCGSK
jgi:PAS domain S-box-containing protein